MIQKAPQAILKANQVLFSAVPVDLVVEILLNSNEAQNTRKDEDLNFEEGENLKEGDEGNKGVDDKGSEGNKDYREGKDLEESEKLIRGEDLKEVKEHEDSLNNKGKKGDKDYREDEDLKEGKQGKEDLDYKNGKGDEDYREGEDLEDGKELEDSEELEEGEYLEYSNILKDIAFETKANKKNKVGVKRNRCIRRDQRYDRELGQFCNRLNYQCQKRKALVCFPLNIGHPLGNHIILEHDWTDQELEKYRDTGILLIIPYSREVLDRSYLVLRFQDISYLRLNDLTHSIQMRRSYQTRIIILQNFLIIGSCLNSNILENTLTPYPYLLLPSEFTSQFKSEYLTQGYSSLWHQGKRYFRNVLKEDNVIKNPNISLTTTNVFQKGGAFIANKNLNPTRYILHEDAIYQVIYNILRKRGTIRIKSP